MGVAALAQVCHINFRNGFFALLAAVASLLTEDGDAAVDVAGVSRHVAGMPCRDVAAYCCCCCLLQFDKHKQTVSDAAVVLLQLLLLQLLLFLLFLQCDKMKTHARPAESCAK